MIRLFWILLTLCWLSAAQARCAPWGMSGLNLFTINFPQGMTQIEVPENQAPFTPLGEWSPAALVSGMATCGGSGYQLLDDAASQPVRIMLNSSLGSLPVGNYSEGGVSYPVYPADGSAVLGYVMRYSLGGPAPLAVAGMEASFTPQPRQTAIDGYFAARLIKISPSMVNMYIPTLALPIQVNLTAQDYYGREETRLVGGYIMTSGIFAQRRTCNIAAIYGISVTLPAISSLSLPVSGSVAGRVPFSLSFNCPNMPSANMYITFTDNTNPGNTGNILSLAPESTVQNVGLQILYDNQPVSFGADSSAAGNTNQLWLSNMSPGYKTFYFWAQYIRPTHTPVTAGSVVARATFTMSYQ